jgi:TetR/AcrR family transcriptional regulator, repressor for neighboring sulfatase
MRLSPVKTKRRVRRNPEAARELILDAADRVFSTKLPDVAGLKDVAKAAGISHALITHYFGTYDALVEATLERRFHRLRAHLLPTMVKLIGEEADARKMLEAHRRAVTDAVSDPAMVRLGIWAALSGRANAADFFPHRMQGLKLLADALESRSKARREDLEVALITSFALAVVWKAAAPAIAGAMGKTPSKGLDAWFEARTAEMLDAYLDRSARRNA